MAALEDLGEVISTDVLVIGGGIGGLTMAIKAKEANPDVDVLMVEKQTTGWAGKATKIGGILAFLGPQDDPDKFLDFQLRTTGFFLNDQNMLSKYIQSSSRAIEDLGAWGANLSRTPEGKVAVINGWVPNWSTTFVDIDFMLPVRAKARKLGTKILNKVHIVDLLKKGNKVVGAVGFDIITGRFHIIKSKATVLANGSCGYKVRRFWMAGTGDGVAAAYRAGAEMRNAEFGNLYGHTVYQDTDSGMVGANFLVNNAGENLAQKYMPNSKGRTGVFLPVELAMGMEKEIAEGRGPIYFAPPQGGPQGQMHRGLPKLTEWGQRIAAKEKKYGLPQNVKRAIAVPLHGETSCVKVDQDMQTSVEGLWAIGDTSYAGSAVAGAVASPPGVTPGSGIMYAVISAGWAGPSAANYASKSAEPEINTDQVKSIKEEIFAPMNENKKLAPSDAISTLQDYMAPFRYNLRRSKDRLEEALNKVSSVKDNLSELKAKDPHYLSKCHEVRSMTLCAELTLKAALMRTESRGFHYREDYPARDDKNWLKWIILKQEGSQIALSTMPIPIAQYKVKP